MPKNILTIRGSNCVTLFLSSSDIHILHQLDKDREQVLEMARTQVARAKKYCSDVEFSPMDATRSEPGYVYRMLTECIEAGATTINVPDTVGYTYPSEYADLFSWMTQNVEGADKVIFILAPLLSLVLAFVGWAAIPFAPGWVVSNLNVGILYLLAMSSLGVYGIIMGGWASNSKYPFLGALRSAAQMVLHPPRPNFYLTRR